MLPGIAFEALEVAVLTLVLSLLLSPAFARPATPPAPTPPIIAEAPVEPAVPAVEDPYLWLEEVEAEASLDWVRAQNTVSQGELAGSPEFAARRERLLSIMDSDAKIPMVSKLGDYYYNFWKDGTHVRGIWRRTTWEEYQKASPAWETVLDIDALGAAEGESWVWAGATCLPPEKERCLISLSRGGADANVVREWDMTTRSFVKGGFEAPEAKQDLGWIDQDTVWVSSDFGPGSLTSSGYARTVRKWTRGTPFSSAELVYEGQESDVAVGAWRDHTKGYVRDWVYRSPTFYSSEIFLLVDGELQKLDKPEDANLSTFREWMYLELRSDWAVGGQTYTAGSLLAIELDEFLAGGRDFDVLFAPGPRTSLAGFSVTKKYVVLATLDNVRSRLEVLKPTKKGWTRAPFPGLPEFGTVNAWAIDAERSDEVFLTITDYVTPTTLQHMRLGKGQPRTVKQLPAFFDATGLSVTQHEATSKDGTKVPYFQVAKTDLALDGTNPTLLYGYGGFEVSMLPGYSGGTGATWLEPGGVYVVANIRGGGEFGPSWHQAALKENRNKAYEDFAAVAEDLVARKVTSVDHLGIMGGSNGGLLVGNMLTDYPTLFGAAVCQVPLLDMKRYNKLLAGASWMGEFGDPDTDDWSFLQRYSPYQKLSAEVDYPRTLFMTSTRDDRVHPGHARKMAARMMEQKHDLLYFENIEGGHGGAADNKQAANMWAMAYTFLWNELK